MTRTKGHTVIVSLPSRERGLKSLSPCSFSDSYRVAPFAGAWIEIQPYLGRQKFGTVAPFAGAWIEIRIKSNHKTSYIVAPFAGAWIEILTLDVYYPLTVSRSLLGSAD